MKNHRHSIIVFFLTCGYALSSAWLGVNLYDEGIIVTGGMRVLHGEMPHRDFASLYPYASYYISAAIQFTFGNGLLPFRLCAAVIFAGICTLSYLFSIRMGLSTFYGTLSSLTICIICGVAPVSLRAVFIALFCTLLSLYLLTGNQRHKTLISLLLLFFASTIRWDIALYGSLAWSVYNATDYGFQWRKLLLYIFTICFTVLLFPLFTLWAFGGETALIQAVEQTIIFPVVEFPSVRGLSLPLFFPRWNGESRADVLLASFALWGMIIFVIVSLMQLFTKKIRLDLPNNRLMLILVVFMIGLMNQARVRSDFEHCIPALFPFIILLFYSISQQHIRKKYIVIMTVFLIGLPSALKGKQWVQMFSYSAFTSQWGHGIYGEHSSSYDSVVYYVQSMTRPDDRILICPDQSQTDQSSDVFLYYATQRIPVSYFHEFHPGITNKNDVQRQIMNDCMRNNCRFILRQHLTTHSSPRKRESPASDILDTFINNNYYTVRTIHDYNIMIPISR